MSTKTKKSTLLTEQGVREYFLLKDMLQAQRRELDLLSKKKSDGVLNKIKIKMINRVLEPLNKLLENEPSHKFLDLLIEDELPTNSDVVLIISQYEKALESFHNKYYLKDKDNRDVYGQSQYRWNTLENPITNIDDDY